MLAIRLRRMGSKKRPYFRVVVTDSRMARDSRFLEVLGHYNPRTKPETVELNHERLTYWVKNGAKPSDTVRTLITRHPAASPTAGEPLPGPTDPTPQPEPGPTPSPTPSPSPAPGPDDTPAPEEQA
jgi:small subunit ribosomal protein S16